MCVHSVINNYVIQRTLNHNNSRVYVLFILIIYIYNNIRISLHIVLNVNYQNYYEVYFH